MTLRWLRRPLAAGLLVAAWETAAHAQVTPADVFIACRHPAAEADSDVTDAELRNLCTRINLPRGSDFVASNLERWRNPRIPTAERIRKFRDAVQKGESSVTLLGGDSLAAPGIRFGRDSTLLSPEQEEALAAVAEKVRDRLAQDPSARIAVTGWADEEGRTAAYNRDLATNRARAIADVFVKNGIGRDRIDTEARIGRGPLRTATNPKLESAGGATMALISRRVVETQNAAATDAPGLTAAPGQQAKIGLSASSLAIGLTDVLVERANAQLQTYVVNEVGRKLCASESAQRRYLPQTCGLFGEDVRQNYLSGVGTLRAALMSDIRRMPERVGFHAIQTRFQAAPARYRDVAQVALFVVHLIQRVEEGGDPLAVIAALDDGDEISVVDSAFKLVLPVPQDPKAMPLTDGLFRFSTLLSQFQEGRGRLAEYWLDGEVPADTVYTYTLRSLLVTAHDPSTPVPDGLVRLLRTRLGDVDQIVSVVRGAERHVDRLRLLAARADSVLVLPSGGREARAAIYTEMLGVLAELASTVPLVKPEHARSVRAVVGPAGRMVTSVRTGAYSEAMYSLFELMRELRATWPGDKGDSLAVFPGEVDGSAMRVLSLSVSLSQAGSQADVNDALRSYIGQARDFFSKREAGPRWRVGLNAYVGGSLGGEWLSGEEIDQSFSGYASVFLPVGLEVGNLCPGGWYCGLLLPVVDLGAIAAARFDNDEFETLPDSDLQRLFTPGGFLVLGIPRVPLSLGVGAVYAPEARTRREEEGVDEDLPRRANAWRVGVFLGVDIPLFP